MVGTIAFRIYEGELGWRLGSDRPSQTGDLDVASSERLSLALGDRVIEPVDRALAELSFEPVLSRTDPGVWRWPDGKDAKVEFLTAAFGTEGTRELPALGVRAMALPYLNFLLREPVQAAALYCSGVLVQVPAPERYALHKLIVADRRRDGPDSLKAVKDRAQADLLLGVLARDRPGELALAWEEAREEGPRWRERIDRSLARMPAAREAIEAALRDG